MLNSRTRITHCSIIHINGTAIIIIIIYTEVTSLVWILRESLLSRSQLRVTMVLRLRPLLPHVRVVLLILCVVASNGALLLNETFHTLDNWVEDVNGATGVIQLLPMNTANDPSVAHTIFTNITQCSATNDEDTCYRAEVATLQSLRPTLFPNCSVEYWVGFSSIIPSTWKYDETGDSLIYNFQLHGEPFIHLSCLAGDSQSTASLQVVSTMASRPFLVFVSKTTP